MSEYTKYPYDQEIRSVAVGLPEWHVVLFSALGAPAKIKSKMKTIAIIGGGPAGATAAINAMGGGDMRAPAPSDPQVDPPSSVITAAHERLGRQPSRFSMAAGLVTIGAVVGLIMAIVARGDADGLIDATATFVDPAHSMAERAHGAAAQAAVLPAFLDTSNPMPTGADKGARLDVGESTVSAPVVNTTPAKTASIQGSDPTTASRPAPARPAPVAIAAPRPARVFHAAPAAQTSTGGWLANITPAGAGAPIARPSKASKPASEFEGAAAADALAKAQLEASLR